VLSNIEMILLSLVNEKASYAYEIDKMLDEKNMRTWLKIGVASVYQVLDRLERKGYLECKKEREGKMPVRKRFFITDKGKEKLKSDVKDLLASLESFYLDLNVGLKCSQLLTPLEIKECLDNRIQKSKSFLQDIKSDYERQKFFLPLQERLIYKSLIKLRETEKTLLEMLEEEYLKDKA